MAPPTPAQLGRYQIETEIGRGMMGVVYRAHDPALGRAVALKTVQLAFPVAEDQKESFEQRFLAEARAAAALSHPSIVVVHDVGRDPVTGTPYIALEYLQGHTLAERVAQGPLPAAEAIHIAIQLAEALHHAHAHGIVHRDIKPANIMLQESGAVKLMDFGVARIPASQLTAAGELFGTPSYMSPEQALAREVDGRSDLFSLGCVLYAMLTGERAFDGPSVPTILAMIAHKAPPPPSARKGGLPRGIDAVVAHALAKEPEHRYPDGRAFAEDLLDVSQGRPPRHTAPRAQPARGESTIVSTVAASVGPPRRKVAAMAVAGLVLLALAGILWMPNGLRTVRPLAPPAEVTLTVEHPLKTGTLRVFVDDDLALEEPLESRVIQRILSVEIRKGWLSKSFDVRPGERVIRVEVEGETFSISRRITGVFESGEKKRLHGEVATLLKKEISLYWRLGGGPNGSGSNVPRGLAARGQGFSTRWAEPPDGASAS